MKIMTDICPECGRFLKNEMGFISCPLCNRYWIRNGDYLNSIDCQEWEIFKELRIRIRGNESK